MEEKVKKFVGAEVPKRIRTIELWTSTVIGLIFIAVILTISITAIILGNNVIRLNQIDLDMEQGFLKAKEAIVLLSQINDQLLLVLIVALDGIIPILVIYLITRIGCNGALLYAEYYCFHTIYPNKQAFKLNCIKRGCNVICIILLMIGSCAYISLIKSDLYQPSKVVFEKINAVFSYIEDNNGSVDNMTLEWWNKHANELQKLFLNIVDTFNIQKKVILDTVHSSSFKNPALGYLVTAIVGIVCWFLSVVIFSSKSLVMKKKTYEESTPAEDLNRLNDYYIMK